MIVIGDRFYLRVRYFPENYSFAKISVPSRIMLKATVLIKTLSLALDNGVGLIIAGNSEAIEKARNAPQTIAPCLVAFFIQVTRTIILLTTVLKL